MGATLVTGELHIPLLERVTSVFGRKDWRIEKSSSFSDSVGRRIEDDDEDENDTE